MDGQTEQSLQMLLSHHYLSLQTLRKGDQKEVSQLQHAQQTSQKSHMSTNQDRDSERQRSDAPNEAISAQLTGGRFNGALGELL